MDYEAIHIDVGHVWQKVPEGTQMLQVVAKEWACAYLEVTQVGRPTKPDPKLSIQTDAEPELFTVDGLEKLSTNILWLRAQGSVDGYVKIALLHAKPQGLKPKLGHMDAVAMWQCVGWKAWESPVIDQLAISHPKLMMRFDSVVNGDGLGAIRVWHSDNEDGDFIEVSHGGFASGYCPFDQQEVMSNQIFQEELNLSGVKRYFKLVWEPNRILGFGFIGEAIITARSKFGVGR